MRIFLHGTIEVYHARLFSKKGGEELRFGAGWSAHYFRVVEAVNNSSHNRPLCVQGSYALHSAPNGKNESASNGGSRQRRASAAAGGFLLPYFNTIRGAQLLLAHDLSPVEIAERLRTADVPLSCSDPTQGNGLKNLRGRVATKPLECSDHKKWSSIVPLPHSYAEASSLLGGFSIFIFPRDFCSLNQVTDKTSYGP